MKQPIGACNDERGSMTDGLCTIIYQASKFSQASIIALLPTALFWGIGKLLSRKKDKRREPLGFVFSKRMDAYFISIIVITAIIVVFLEIFVFWLACLV